MGEVGGEVPTVNVSSPSVPVKRLTDIGADYFNWADDGKTVTWPIGASFFRQPVSAVNFEPPQPEEKKDGDKKDADKKDNEKKNEKTAGKKKKKFKEKDKKGQENADDIEISPKTTK